MSGGRLHDGRFARVERMLGKEKLRRLMGASVCVVGLGAVGSYAVEALARAGVGRIRAVDFDEVRLSNINRQLYAAGSTVGKKKCEVARERILDINPRCEVEAMELFVHDDTIERVLGGKLDVVIDAIDSLTPKVILLDAVQQLGIPVISAMGAALRTDPLHVRVGLLEKVYNCPLAAKVRKSLRKRGASVRFMCVYSTEWVARDGDRGEEMEDAAAEQTLSRGRERRPLGSLPTLTGIFGLTAANAAIEQIVGGFGR